MSAYLNRGFKNLSKVEASTFRAFIGLLILLVIIGSLIAYKTTASLAVISRVQAAGDLKPRFNLIQSNPSSVWFSALDRTFSYFYVVWPALLFGLLISGAVRAFISPMELASVFGRSRARAQLVAGLAGAPLMLCSCCVAPIFTTVYERSTRLAPSLAFMFASPLLNPAALILTFMLFGGKVGAVRLVVSGIVVLSAGVLAERLISVKRPLCPYTGGDSTPSRSLGRMATDFLSSCLKVTYQTVPLILAGVVISMLLARWLPLSGLGSGSASILAIMVVALVAVPIAMPTFFEIPLALMAVAAGLPSGAAVAILIAGPATNLPSLLTVARSAGWRVSAFVALAVWGSALAGGLCVGLI